MDIRPLAPAIPTALRSGQERFATAVDRVVESTAPATAPAVGDDTAASLVDLRSEALVNQVLFSVFKAQSDQQREVASLLDQRHK